MRSRRCSSSRASALPSCVAHTQRVSSELPLFIPSGAFFSVINSGPQMTRDKDLTQTRPHGAGERCALESCFTHLAQKQHNLTTDSARRGTLFSSRSITCSEYAVASADSVQFEPLCFASVSPSRRHDACKLPPPTTNHTNLFGGEKRHTASALGANFGVLHY